MRKIVLKLVSLLVLCCFVGCSTNAAGTNNNGFSNDNTCSHNWRSATCTEAKKCSLCGDTQGSELGHNYSDATCTSPRKCQRCSNVQGAALGHQYSSGYCIRCNAKDPNYVEYGTVQGTVTYKYNNYVGNRGDSGSLVYLFPNMSGYDTSKYDNSRACRGFTGEYDSGIMVTKCDGNGNYVFDNVPVGRYYLLIISAETTDGGAFDNKASRESWIKANFMDLLSSSDIEALTLEIGYQKIYTENLDVLTNRTHTVSKDFGITYI